MSGNIPAYVSGGPLGVSPYRQQFTAPEVVFGACFAPEFPFPAQVVIRRAIVATLDSYEIETGSNVLSTHHDQVEMEPPELSPLQDA
jgi:hypothetical protein